MNVEAVIDGFVAQEKNRLTREKQLDYEITRCEKSGKSLNPISRSHAKRIALAYAKKTRSHRFKRVSKSFLIAVENNAMAFIKDRVNRLPSRGQTLS